MHTENVEYESGGQSLIGYLAFDETLSGPRPAVLVAHEGPGLDDNAKKVAERMSSLGYVAFALDYHGGGTTLSGAEIMPRLEKLISDPERTRALGRAGLEILLGREEVDRRRVAAIGYCFGGTMALELARDGAELAAVVGFHSGLGTIRPGAQNVVAKILVCIGASDPLIPPAQRQAFEEEMSSSGVDWRLNLYGGAGHSFTNPHAGDAGMDGVAYHESSDRRSWAAMLDLFGETIAG